MSCPKCEPAAKSRRWLWWLGLAVLLSMVAWLDASGALGSPLEQHRSTEKGIQE
jgi:hypothetical protein